MVLFISSVKQKQKACCKLHQMKNENKELDYQSENYKYDQKCN